MIDFSFSLLSLFNFFVSACFTLIGALSWNLLASRKSRADSFFGVRVEPGFAESETGRAILRQFRLRLWWGALLLAVLVQSLGFAGIEAGILLSTLFGGLVFADAHRRTKRQAPAQPVPALRVASVAGGEEPRSPLLDVLDWLAMIVPPALPASALMLTIGRHPRDAAQLFLIVFALVIGLTCAANQWALRYRARSSDWASIPADSRRFRTLLGVMMALIYTVPIWFICDDVLLPSRAGAPAFFTVLVVPEVVLICLVHSIRFWLTKHLDNRSSDPMPDSCWKWGWCYWNSSDPALVVPMRTGVGLSFNCGHAGIRLAMGIFTTLTVVSLVMTMSMVSNLNHMLH